MSKVTLCRPAQALDVFGGDFPSIWKIVDQCRSASSTNQPSWPSWCFLPFNESVNAIKAFKSKFSPSDRISIQDVWRLSALSAWRAGKGVYRFDPDVLDALRDTPLDGDIPCAVLYRLPEWCIYLETPGMTFGSQPLYGVWAHLESVSKNRCHQLRLLLDRNCDTSDIAVVAVDLGKWSLAEGLRRAFYYDEETAPVNLEDFRTILQMTEVEVQPLLSMLLYLCSQAAEIGTGLRQPANPAPVTVGGLKRTFQAKKASVWDVGVRLGASLRRSLSTASNAQDAGVETQQRPHLRRAHWQGYWFGPRKDAAGAIIPMESREYELKWIAPIIVNETSDSLPATIRKVA